MATTSGLTMYPKVLLWDLGFEAPTVTAKPNVVSMGSWPLGITEGIM